MSNRQPVLYLDELVRSDRGPVPTEIVHFLCEKRSAHMSECSVVPIHIRLPFLDAPRCKRGCVKRGEKEDNWKTYSRRSSHSMRELPPTRHTASGLSQSILMPPLVCSISSHGFRIPTLSICVVSWSIIAVTAASTIRFLAKGKVKRLRGT